MLVKAMLPPFEFKSTAPVDRVRAPIVSPSYPLQFNPSRVTAPAKLVAVSPSAKVTSWANFTLVAAPALNPLFAPKVPWKSTNPTAALSTVSAAPVPSPKALTAPLTVVVPAAVPAAIDKSWLPPAKVVSAIFPP